MKKIIGGLLLTCCSLFAYQVPSHPTPDAFKKELGIEIVAQNQLPSKEKRTHMYLIHHGSTEWSEMKRIQGQANLPLSERGKKEMQTVADKLPNLEYAGIFASSQESAMQSGEILQNKFKCSLFGWDELRNENPGNLQGMTKEEYEKNGYYQFYHALPMPEEMFTPVGEGGESKADILKRVVPALKEIAKKHPGENVIIVAHGGLFKALNYYLGKTSSDNRSVSLPYGEVMEIDADENTLYLAR